MLTKNWAADLMYTDSQLSNGSLRETLPTLRAMKEEDQLMTLSTGLTTKLELELESRRLLLQLLI
jgi:hypothetical protein